MMKEIDIDVTVAGLECLVEVLRRQWVGDCPDREDGPRVGTLYVSPDLTSLRLAIRFPLDLQMLEGLLQIPSNERGLEDKS